MLTLDLDFEQEDDGYTAGGSVATGTNTVVFSEKSFRDEPISKAEMKSFMVGWTYCW